MHKIGTLTFYNEKIMGLCFECIVENLIKTFNKYKNDKLICQVKSMVMEIHFMAGFIFSTNGLKEGKDCK